MESKYAELQVEDEAIALLEGENEGKKFCDYEFIPHPRSLYLNEHFIPAYDQGVHTEVAWCRPEDLYSDPQYFKSASYTPRFKSGRYVLSLCVFGPNVETFTLLVFLLIESMINAY